MHYTGNKRIENILTNFTRGSLFAGEYYSTMTYKVRLVFKKIEFFPEDQ